MKSFLFLTILVMLSSLHADSNQFLIGAEFGQSKGHWNDYDNDTEDNIGLRVGLETDKTRIYISYNYFESESLVKDLGYPNTDYESHILALNFDAKTDKYYKFFRGFAGIHVGGLYSQWDLSTYPLSDDRDDLDLIYGGKAGLIVEFVDSVYIEAGYKYSFTSAGEDSINPANIQTYYGALNFKF